jgi:hypothetical protein
MMIVLGIESSCDETGVALVETSQARVPALLAHALHSQVEMHQAYGGVVPELASRDHIRRVLPLARQVLAEAGHAVGDVDVVAYTRGPGLAGALLVGAGVACALGAALGKPVLGVHHLEGHLLSPFLSADPPEFPFIALLVSGGHTQLMQVDGVGSYQLLGETIDDAAGEAFDKSAKLMGLGYPGGPALVQAGAARRPQGLQAAAAAAAQRRPRFFLCRPEDGGADAVAQAGCGARSAQGRPGGVHRSGDRRGAGEEVADGAGAQRPAAHRGGRRRGREPAPARAAECSLRQARRARALPRAGTVHRQRRHDRAGGRHAAAGRRAAGDGDLCLRRQAALAISAPSTRRPR